MEWARLSYFTEATEDLQKKVFKKSYMEFDKEKAVISDEAGKVMCTFVRTGGLYVARLKLKSPELFGRQAR